GSMEIGFDTERWPGSEAAASCIVAADTLRMRVSRRLTQVTAREPVRASTNFAATDTKMARAGTRSAGHHLRSSTENLFVSQRNDRIECRRPPRGPHAEHDADHPREHE